MYTKGATTDKRGKGLVTESTKKAVKEELKQRDLRDGWIENESSEVQSLLQSCCNTLTISSSLCC